MISQVEFSVKQCCIVGSWTCYVSVPLSEQFKRESLCYTVEEVLSYTGHGDSKSEGSCKNSELTSVLNDSVTPKQSFKACNYLSIS